MVEGGMEGGEGWENVKRREVEREKEGRREGGNRERK